MDDVGGRHVRRGHEDDDVTPAGVSGARRRDCVRFDSTTTTTTRSTTTTTTTTTRLTTHTKRATDAAIS